MGVAVQEDRLRRKGAHGGLERDVVPVAGVDLQAVALDDRVVRHGKGQKLEVDLGVAVAAHGRHGREIHELAEELRHVQRPVAAGQGIAGAVVEHVAKEHGPGGLELLHLGQQELEALGQAVQVGRDDHSHDLASFVLAPASQASRGRASSTSITGMPSRTG